MQRPGALQLQSPATIIPRCDRSTLIVEARRKKWVDRSGGRKAPCRPVTQDLLLKPLDQKTESRVIRRPSRDRIFALPERALPKFFYIGLKQYKAYIEEFKTPYVPLKVFDMEYLVKWVADMRKCKEQDLLLWWQVEILNDLGFPWDIIEPEEDWFQHFHNGVRYYYSLTGCTGHIPENFRNPAYPDIEAAAPWLQKQQELYWWQNTSDLRIYANKAHLLMRHAVPMNTISGRVGHYARLHPDRFMMQKETPRPQKRKFAPQDVIDMMNEDPYAKYKRDKYLKMLTG